MKRQDIKGKLDQLSPEEVLSANKKNLPSALHGRHKDPSWQEAWDVKTLHSDAQ